jgi:hypothetical protein
MEYICIRCCLDFKEKVCLIRHLKKKKKCIALDKNLEDLDQLTELTKKEGITCKKCNGIYKNNETLRKHKCKGVKKNIEEETVTKKELKELYDKQVCDLKNIIQELLKNPQNVVNNNTNNIKNIDNSTNINITLNCLMDTTDKPIKYLLNQDDIEEKIIGWLKLNQKLIPAYINEKYYNKNHPENHMIRAGDNKESIELHIGGKWRQYENIRGSDMILTNIGNDFGVFLDMIKENIDLYTEKKKIIKQFEKDVIKPLSWGLESSEDTNKDKEFQLMKNDDGEYVRDDDEEYRIKRDNIQIDVIKHIHEF